MNFNALCALLADTSMTIQTDSRLVQHGDIFVSIPPAISSHLGVQLPSLDNLIMSIEKGAQYILIQKNLWDEGLSSYAVTWIIVDDCRQSLGELANIIYKTNKLPFPILAICGTNGKTTSAYLLEHLYAAHNKQVGMLGTVSYHWQGHYEDAPLTTPDCLRTHEALSHMKKAHIDVCIMEVSSHALDQNRVAGIDFNGSIFTNLTQDHLDYHGNMENYYNAKARLFTNCSKSNTVQSIFAKDPYGKRILAACPNAQGFCLITEEHPMPTMDNTLLTGRLLENSPNGLVIEHRYQGKSWTLSSKLVGEHNAYNILGVECLALQLGFSVKDLEKLSSFNGVPGRLERISTTKSIANNTSFFVDYAHTPDALVHAQNALRQAGFKRIITVFGCGGDRDKTKRPLMGEAVAKRSDIVILTSDNPRTENPDSIMDDIAPSLGHAKEIHRETDRKNALKLACELAQAGDAVLVAGKGHETYQVIGTKKFPFSDQDILKEFLQ